MNAKKLVTLLGVSSLLFVGAAQAGWEGNFLLGAEGGYAWRDADLNAIILPSPVLRQDETRRHHDNGFLGGFLAGYQVTCNNLLLGLEGSLSWQGFGDYRYNHAFDIANVTNNQVISRHERGTVFGLTMRAGYKLTSWMMPYVRAGAETSRDTIKVAVHDQTTPLQNVFSLDSTRRNYRFVGGAGVEFPFVMQSVVRMEYNYSSRGRGAEGSVGDSYAAGAILNANIKPDQHTALLAVVWNFI